MQRVFLDSMILSWGMIRTDEGRSDAEKEWIPRAKALLSILEEKNLEICVPTVVQGELLASIPLKDHARFIKEMHRRFRMFDFTSHVASVYADILHRNDMNGTIAKMKDERLTARTIKADHMIVATVKAHSGDCLFSTDGGVASFGAGHIRVINLDTEPSGHFKEKAVPDTKTTSQQSLFELP